MQRVEYAHVNREMSVSVHQQLADHIHFVVAGAFRMETLNTAAVFEDVADRLNIGIPLIMEGRNVMGTVIGKEAYREFEGNHHVGTLFAEV